VSSKLQCTQKQFGRRFRQVRELSRQGGTRILANKLRAALAERLAPKGTYLPVRPADVMDADLSRSPQFTMLPIDSGQPLLVNWITTPPSAGSGGHTTLFRIVRYLESRGYRNRIYFYDVFHGDHEFHKSVVREYFGFLGPVADVSEGMEDAHIVMATGWPTAYPAFNSKCAGKRFYFVQDYEPSFHPTGAASLLAENTYRMGFHGVTAGKWLAGKLSQEFGMSANYFDFGCDCSSYSRMEGSSRSGLVFYARPEAARRGSELGLMALEVFAARHPEITIHLYGEVMGRLPFKFVNHGRVTPSVLNKIYNSCYAGLSLSLSNVSLVPHEMLAAGCIPIVNEGIQNRIVLDNPFVRYSAPFPQALASALESIVMDPDVESLSAAAAESVRSVSWDDAGAKVDQVLRQALKGDRREYTSLVKGGVACAPSLAR
jgi:WsaF, C-terminal domain/WsaF, N-terminal domain